jgi:hypothetical protein
MATSQTQAAAERELEALADYGATLGELLDHIEEQNDRLGSFSDDQEEELQVYCWRVHRHAREGFPGPRPGYGRVLDDDIGG